MKFEIKRKIDELGRIVLPIDMRNYYEIGSGDTVVLLPVREGIQIAKADLFILNQLPNDVVVTVDELGRIVLPIELRRTLDISERDELEIYMENDRIILQKFEPACVFCGSFRNLISFRRKNVCSECVRKMGEY